MVLPGWKEDSSYDRDHRRSQAYDSTQSLYDTRYPGGYLDCKSGANVIDHQRRGARFQRQAIHRNIERASMRAESGQRRVCGRKRNDSINSTQSERPPNNTVSGFKFKDYILVFNKGFFLKFYENYLYRLQACSNGLEIENALSHDRGNVRGILRLTISDNSLHPIVSMSGAKSSQCMSRIRHDSDRSSSIGGSIAEGCESGDEGSGERTPTKVREDSRWSNWGGRRTTGGRSPGRRIRMNSNSKSARYGNEYSSGDYYRDSQWSRDIKHYNYRGDHDFNREEPIGSNRLRGRGSVKNGSVGQNIVRQGIRTERGRPYEPPAMRGSIFYLSLKIVFCFTFKRIFRISSSNLSDIYYGILTRDVNFTFSMNLEQHLWKQAYHKLIEALRTASNSIKDGSKTLRTLLLSLLQTGIEFYKRLLKRYESEFDLLLSSALLWPSGLPSDDFGVISIGCHPSKQYDKGKQKLAIKSCARHLIALGDLNRYKTLVEGSEDYMSARVCYLQSVQLWPASGHGYNQLGVVAFFSVFSLVLISHHFVEKYEQLLDSDCGRVHAEVELAERADRPRELWLSIDGSVEAAEGKASDVYASFLEQAPSKLHRRTISYIVDTAGLLITKIGMETFASISERAIGQLAALLDQNGSPITSMQLVQISLIFIYAVHTTEVTGDVDTCSLQQQMALRTLISLLGVLLRPISQLQQDLRYWLTGEKELPFKVISYFLNSNSMFLITIFSQVMRVLPAVCIISEWLSCPIASAVYRTMPSVEPLPMSVILVDTWQYMADLANALINCEREKILGSIGEGKVYGINNQNKVLLALHVRLHKFLLAAEYLNKSNLECFSFSENEGKFVKNEPHDSEKMEEKRKHTDIDHCDKLASLRVTNREELLEREQRKKQTVMVVRPINLVPDTNAFVDHLDYICKIVASGRFQIIVPTIVIEELIGLSQNRPKEVEDPHIEFVMAQARRGVTWLKERAREKCAKMKTLTTQGQTLAISIVSEDTGDYDARKVNDDHILQSCISFVERTPVVVPSDINPACFESDMPPIYRNLVLLTEDRGLNIKATSQNIPLR
uniref:PINc domain-containing protein n=1 Tax=Heterorhabditis bacteriophora TaxID=37862 RepID=A0A1I7XSK2_HETBA